MNLISDDRRDFLARANHTLDRAKLKMTLVAATAGAGQGITVHVLHGADPAHLVFIARSLLEQAAEWMEANDGILDEDNGGTRHPLNAIVSECVDILTTEVDDDGE